MMSASGHVLLVTGASRGIGNAIAERLLRDGHRLSLGVRDPDGMRGTRLDVERWGADRLLIHPYEAQDPASASAWVEASACWSGGFNTLIHCAGILRSTPLLFADGDDSDLNELWQINVMGPWWLTRAAWPFLSSSGQGRIQVLVSMSGKRCKGQMAGYPVSKFALMGLCQAIRNEGWQAGIRITAICPSWVNTAMARSVSSVDPLQMTQPEDIATLSSTLLQVDNAAVPFELAVNCALET